MNHSNPKRAMTSRERFLAAMSNQIPDRVPVSPDMSNSIPCKRTGLPFWDIYFNGAIPLWKAYLDTADYYGIDAWTAASGSASFVFDNPAIQSVCKQHYDTHREAMILRKQLITPDGTMESEEVCYRDVPPTPFIKPIADPVADRDKARWFFQLPDRLDEKATGEFRTACHKRNYAFGLPMGYPGLHSWEGMIQGGVTTLSYLLADAPEILDEWFDLHLAQGTRMIELMIEAKPDYILFGGSGTITLASPALARKYAIPALKKWSQMAAMHGIPTILHSCGKSWSLLEMLATETEVNCVNPLEIPPMGDTMLRHAKETFGGKLALMGNLHTTDLMLRGTAEQVKQSCLEAIRDAAQGGGFILSTGDQCGRDTPEENIFTMVETAITHGQY